MKELIYSKSSGDGGGSSSVLSKTPKITRPTKMEKLYRAITAIYLYHDGTVEIGKNVNGEVGKADLNMAVKEFARIIAEMKLQETQLDMFKEGLSQLLCEAINEILKGDYYEGTICSESAGNGPECNRSI